MKYNRKEIKKKEGEENECEARKRLSIETIIRDGRQIPFSTSTFINQSEKGI